jgi:hypothetical protein
MSGLGYIAHEPDQACGLCGTIDECRPYGPNGEQICFDCGLKDQSTTEKKMVSYIFGDQNAY